MNQPPGNFRPAPRTGTEVMQATPMQGQQPPQQQSYGAPQPGPAYGAAPQQPMMPGAAPYGVPPAQPMGAPYGQPGVPGAPQQQPQQGTALPQIGFGGIGRGGMPRISVGGGDFSPGKLVAAITTGQGFNSPRKMGAIMLGVGFALAAINTVMVLVLHLYYPYLYSIGAIFWWGGLWLAITGQPGARPDGSKAPTWGRIGLAVCLVFGLLAGISMITLNWEQMLVR